MTKKIRLLVLGTGGMAKAHATAFAQDADSVIRTQLDYDRIVQEVIPCAKHIGLTIDNQR